MATAARISDLFDLRWAQLASPHARHLLLAAAECHRFQPIPHRLLQLATRLEPQAYRAACDLLSDLGLVRAHPAGPIITRRVATHARRAAARHHLPSRLPAVARAAIHLTSKGLVRPENDCGRRKSPARPTALRKTSLTGRAK